MILKAKKTIEARREEVVSPSRGVLYKLFRLLAEVEIFSVEIGGGNVAGVCFDTEMDFSALTTTGPSEGIESVKTTRRSG